MAVDNFEKIKSLVDCNEDEFYLLQIIHRSKDGLTRFDKDGEKSHFSNKTIKSYYVNSTEYLDKKRDEIIELCHMFNARAYFNPNVKSNKQITLKCLSELAHMVSVEDYKGIRSLLDSACGRTGSASKDKFWIVDVDTKDMNEVESVKAAIIQCEPVGGEKIVKLIPTVHGYHIISRPFNKKRFRDLYHEQIDIHDNNPTLLYYQTLS